MEQRVSSCSALRGEIALPGDKSISHRAVILNSLARGRAMIENLSPGDDVKSTISCMRALGVHIVEEGDKVSVSGVGMDGLKAPGDVLDAGNSGTTMRLLTGLLAAQPFFSIITGDESLRSRPMGRLIQPLRQMGAEVWGRRKDSRAPLAIKGHMLKGINYRLPVASAQLKSAILIAALFAQGDTIVTEPGPSRDHTERMMKAMGVNIRRRGDKVELSPSDPRTPLDLHVPGDISSAAFWLVAGAIHPDAQIKVMDVGINPTRSGIIDVLRQMGARLKVERERMEGGEPVADLVIESGPMIGIKVGGRLIPRVIDEIPLIALAACFAHGTTIIRDAKELRVKESDRIRATVRELSRLGADIKELRDGMVINGSGDLKGGDCDSHMDHRLAMTLGVAALVSKNETIVRDAHVVSVSYPDFWQHLGGISR